MFRPGVVDVEIGSGATSGTEAGRRCACSRRQLRAPRVGLLWRKPPRTPEGALTFAAGLLYEWHHPVGATLPVRDNDLTAPGGITFPQGDL